MAVKSRAEILAVLVKSGERIRKVNEAAQTRALVRSGGEEALSPTIDLPSGPSSILTGQNPGTGAA